MLNCILGMVDKTKRALAILQQRQSGMNYAMASELFSSDSSNSARRNTSTTMMNDLLAATIRSTEERVIEVRRRAEEAVQEVTNELHETCKPQKTLARSTGNSLVFTMTFVLCCGSGETRGHG